MENRALDLRRSYVAASRKAIDVLINNGYPVTYEEVSAYYGKPDLQKLFVFKYAAEVQKRFAYWADASRFVKKIADIADADDAEPVDPCDIIDMIHKSGGFAIWAHPFLTPEPLRSQCFESFKAHGVDAIEAEYAYQQNSYKGKETNAEIEALVRAHCKELGIAVSGGSDSHYPAKTYEDQTPVLPGDFGINDQEFEVLKHMFG
jgi:hypothetical protein